MIFTLSRQGQHEAIIDLLEPHIRQQRRRGRSGSGSSNASSLYGDGDFYSDSCGEGEGGDGGVSR